MKALRTSTVENARKLLPATPLDQVIMEDLLPQVFVESQLSRALVHQVEEDSVQGEDELQRETQE